MTPSPPLATLVAQFASLHSLLFSAQNACLRTSLSLLLFLRAHGCSPAWVFGVRTAPFSAHCWLQAGDLVLDETIEGVSPYVPILVVGRGTP